MTNQNDPNEWPNTVRPGDPIPPDSVVGNSPLNPANKNRPPSKAQLEAERQAWLERQLERQEREYAAELEYTPPTAWQSLPSPIRFAIWLWAITAIVGFMAAVLAGLVFVITFASAVS